MDFKKNIEKYAELILKVGLNIQKNDGIYILVNEHSIGMVREITKQAYKLGAKDIIYDFSDDDMILSRYNYGNESIFNEMPKFKIDYLEAAYKNNYHRIALVADNPELLKDVDSKKVAAWNKTRALASKPIMKYTMENRVKWTVAAHPTPAWAKTVFPDLSEDEALKKLWEKVFDATRVSMPEPVKAWQEHDAALKKHQNFLNEMQFEKLLYKGPGTDLEVYLVEGHLWVGGSGKCERGETFMANIPTEEVFSMPHAFKVNGTVKATKPLAARGKIIDGFYFTFKDGKVTDFDAKEGKETLQALLDSDEGARRLGEVALVADNSPISNTGILFKNTLFDENASCHFAIGNAYSENIKNGAFLSDEEAKKSGMNNSIIHVDFMVGGPELSVIGVKKDGSKIELLKNGNWVI
ncbi:aminopeptidase [Treponema pedis]|uniref:aminopeptidase n=1 Tax=Treponema pedis TaxID=409322 RepID=UPI000429DB44|nr:aminopeptidase [Treponema pedis]